MSERDRGVSGALAIGIVGVLCASIPNPDVGYERYEVAKEFVASVAIVYAMCISVLRGGRPAFSTLTWIAIGACLTALVVARRSEFGLQWNGVRETAMTVVMLVAYELARALGPDARRRVLGAIVAALAAGSLIVLAEGCGLIPTMSLPGRGPGGLMGNRNFAAEVAVFGVIAATSLSSSGLQRHLVLASRLAAAACGAAVVLSRGRTAMIGLALALAASLLPRHRQGERARCVTAGATLLGTLAGLALSVLVWSPSAVRSTFDSIADVGRGSGRGRMIQAEATTRILAGRHGLGVGVGNWAAAYSLARVAGDSTFNARMVEPIGRIPSSDWVDLISDQGLLGVMAIAGWFGSQLIAGRRGISDGDDQLVMRRATIVCAAAIGVGDALLHQAHGALIVGTLLGVLAPMRGEDEAFSARAGVPRTPLHDGMGLTGSRRRVAVGRVATLLVVLIPLASTIVVTAREGLALALFSRELQPDTLDRLAAVAPGLYFLHVHASARLAVAHRCLESADHALRADILLPGRPITERMAAFCHPAALTARESSDSAGLPPR